MVIRTILDKRRANKENKFPVKLRFTDRNKSAYCSLNIYADTEEFDEASGYLTTTEKKEQRRINRENALILSCYEKADSILKEYQKKNKYISPAELKELYEADSIPEEEEEQEEKITFNNYFRNAIELKTKSTAVTYRNTLNKIEEYFPEAIYFESIDKAWLKLFIQKMRTEKVKRKDSVQVGLSLNSQSIHLRNLRSVYNDAIDDKIIGYDSYPFRKFIIETEEIKHRAITVEELRKIFTYSGTDSENWARDVAKLIFYLIGINAVDLHRLSEVRNGYASYRRSKTGRIYTIKLEPEAIELMEQFKGRSNLLSFSEQFSDSMVFIRKINGQTIYKKDKTKIVKRGLNTIGEAIGINRLTSYVFRHTWATIAGKLDIPKETIAAALGHGKKTVTDIYIDFDQKKIDEANRKVIDHVLGISKQKRYRNKKK